MSSLSGARPGHIQRHGVLLALAEHDLAIVIASANAPELLGIDLDRILGAGIASVLAEPSEKVLRELLAHDELAVTRPLEARSHGGRVLDAVLHRANELLVIELEPAARRVGA